MIPVQQLNRHEPPHAWGDCARACIASLLEVPCDFVPNFCEPGPGEVYSAERTQSLERMWLLKYGIAPVKICYSSALPTVLATIGYYNPGLHWILTGTSRNKCHHDVIACDGQIVHDPSLDQSGIIGPCEDGFYWVTFLGASLGGASLGRK